MFDTGELSDEYFQAVDIVEDAFDKLRGDLVCCFSILLITKNHFLIV